LRFVLYRRFWNLLKYIFSIALFWKICRFSKYTTQLLMQYIEKCLETLITSSFCKECYIKYNNFFEFNLKSRLLLKII
jgi:hypothetical protein